MAIGFGVSGPAEGRMQERPAAGPAMTDEEPGGDAEANVSPEEQKVYDQVVANALRIIASPKTREGLLDTLGGEGKPAEGLALAASTIAKRVFDSARENGVEVSGDVMLAAGEQIVGALAEVQSDAGIADLSTQEIDGAYLRGLDLFREAAQADGSLDRAAFEQDFATMVEADKAGKLDEVVPGASEAAAQMGATEGEEMA